MISDKNLWGVKKFRPYSMKVATDSFIWWSVSGRHKVYWIFLVIRKFQMVLV